MKADSVATQWIERGNKLLADGMKASHELPHFATSMMAFFYGASSPQLRSFQENPSLIWKRKDGAKHEAFLLARGAVQNTIEEVQRGLVVNLRATVQGEILGDLIGLSKEALSLNSDGTKNVAAVLAAAAFEDVLRRLAEEKAQVQDRPKLETLVGILKDASLIQGGNISLATSMLKFRNDSLHADWNQVQRGQIEGCIAFVEGILREHFS